MPRHCAVVLFMTIKQMTLKQEKSYLLLRELGYEFEYHNDHTGTVIMNKYEYTGESKSLKEVANVYSSGEYKMKPANKSNPL
ncbi:hypothetical protein UFOVP1090_4 [uncultured Caudovirales phage]|uniref:Uncharacterized protein n=1 Tax=uncultured Caudovirales phage TaxID=2100421 RepID=A0A6J5QC86_9CAUD|nr:hypothetical protein UFOVP1090_4 [uncultured Caudovirales phage]